MSSMFYILAEIPTIVFPAGFDTGNVTTMGSMFSGCKTPTLNFGWFQHSKSHHNGFNVL